VDAGRPAPRGRPPPAGVSPARIGTSTGGSVVQRPGHRVRWGWVLPLGLALALAAAAGASRRASADASAASAHLALVLCIDTSGSMVQNDPSGSRVAAARQIAASLGPGDQLGIVGFADAPAVLLPLQPMGTPAALAAVDAALGRVGAQGATDILGAINTGAGLLAADGSAADLHVLILLTDGVPDLPALSVPAALQAYEAQMQRAAQALAQRGWVLDTVGLGGGVDGQELASLAELGGGTYAFAPSAADLSARLLALYSAARSRVPAPVPPASTAASNPVRVDLQPGAVPAALVAGRQAELPVRVNNPASEPQTLALVPASLPPGWRAPDSLVVPAGSSVVDLPLGVGAAPIGAVAIALQVSPPPGVEVPASPLVWHLRVRPRWKGWLLGHASLVGAAAAVAAAALLLLGYGGYALLVLPRMRPRGRLDVTAPGGERLGALRLPRRCHIAVGAAAASGAALRLPWVPGEDVLFSLRVDLSAGRAGTRWRAGLAAWRRPPHAIVYAEAEWPYHLYPGPLPQRRVDLYENTSFGAAGLTFTFRPMRGGRDAEPLGADLLRSL
jgi:Mg-chelatase subunit ChlD